MRYKVLATDYDGTLAKAGRVDPEVVEALRQVKASGRRLILVTGRILPDLLALFPEITLFDRVIAENGALLYRPENKRQKLLAQPPPDEFLESLRKAGVQPLEIGRVVVSTHQPNEHHALTLIRKLGLELTLTFNKGSVMILPSGITKATGLKVALDEIHADLEETVGVGDGENDHIFLQACGFAVAVDNALPMLKKEADVVTRLPNGSGMLELMEELVARDLANYLSNLPISPRT